MSKNKRPTQQDRIYNGIELNGGEMDTNEIRAFGAMQLPPIADPETRCREMARAGRLGRRKMSTYEMEQRRLKTKVKIFFIAG